MAEARKGRRAALVALRPVLFRACPYAWYSNDPGITAYLTPQSLKAGRRRSIGPDRDGPLAKVVKIYSCPPKVDVSSLHPTPKADKVFTSRTSPHHGRMAARGSGQGADQRLIR